MEIYHAVFAGLHAGLCIYGATSGRMLFAVFNGVMVAFNAYFSAHHMGVF